MENIDFGYKEVGKKQAEQVKELLEAGEVSMAVLQTKALLENLKDGVKHEEPEGVDNEENKQ